MKRFALVVVPRFARVSFSVGLALLAVLALLLTSCGGASAPRAATPAAAPTTPAPPSLAGTWTLVAADDLLPDGARVPAYGPEPRGLLIVDAQGRYSLQIFRSGRPRYAAGDKRRGTPAEFEASVLGMSTHTGRCAIDPDGTTLTFHIELAAFPNWEGTEQKRQFTLVGDELTYQLPAGVSGTSALPISVWRRVATR